MKKITLGILLFVKFSVPGYAEGLLAINNPAKNGQEQQVYASVEAFAANDQVAINRYGSDWQGDYSARNGINLGLLSFRAEGGVQWQGFRLGGLRRAEALVEANRDASDLLRQYTGNSGYDLGRIYQFDLRIKGFEADGARLSKSFQLDMGEQWQMDWGLGLSSLHGKRIKLETLSGQAVTLNAQDVDAVASLTDTDSQSILPTWRNLTRLTGVWLLPMARATQWILVWCCGTVQAGLAQKWQWQIWQAVSSGKTCPTMSRTSVLQTNIMMPMAMCTSMLRHHAPAVTAILPRTLIPSCGWLQTILLANTRCRVQPASPVATGFRRLGSSIDSTRNGQAVRIMIFVSTQSALLSGINGSTWACAVKAQVSINPKPTA